MSDKSTTGYGSNTLWIAIGIVMFLVFSARTLDTQVTQDVIGGPVVESKRY